MTYKFYSEIYIIGTDTYDDYDFSDDDELMAIVEDKKYIGNYSLYYKLAQKSLSHFTRYIVGFKEKGLALFFNENHHEENILSKKISFIKPSFVIADKEYEHEKVILLTECEANTELTFYEINMLKRYIKRQYENEFGEKFSDKEYKSSVETYVPTVNFFLFDDYRFRLYEESELGKYGYELVEDV